MCYKGRMANDDDKKRIGGGFGRQTESTGRPQMIPTIQKIPVSFEEFMKDSYAIEIQPWQRTVLGEWSKE